jgi:N-acetylneuraminic acid mutarotase
VIGGSSPSNVTLSRVDAFDLATNTWSPRAPLPGPRSNLNGASAINGRIYVSGGRDASGAQTKTLFVYNPATDTWSRKADMPRNGGCGTQGVIEGLLYVTTDCGLFGSDTTRFYRYEPATNTWTRLASPPGQFNDAGVSGVIGGKFYLAGEGALFVAYDPATKRWTERASTVHPERYMCGAVLNGKLFVAGGHDASAAEAGDPGALPTLRVYNPTTDTWHFRTSMPTPRWGAAGAAAVGRFFVISGYNETSVIRKVVAYTP